MCDAIGARCADSEEKARAAIDSGELSDLNAFMAALALVMSAALLGHAADVIPVAHEAIERAAGSYETAPMRFWFGGVYLRACRLNGLLDECQRATEGALELARDAPGRPYANLIFLRVMPRCCAVNYGRPRDCCARHWPRPNSTAPRPCDRRVTSR
jgi:hypothetical protein